MIDGKKDVLVERGAVERTLLSFLGQPDSERLALRARLRHLDSLRLLDLPKVGSGRRISYTASHVFWMALALELEFLGQAPKRAVTIVHFVQEEVGPPLDGLEDRYLLIYPTTFQITNLKAAKTAIESVLAVTILSLEQVSSKLRDSTKISVPCLPPVTDQISATVSIVEHILRERDGVSFD